MEEKEPQLPQLECQLKDLTSREEGKTVGDLMELSCAGLWQTPLSDNVKIQFENEAMKYSLHIVDVKESSSTNWVADVTSYKPNDYSQVKFLIVDGATQYQVNPLSWSYNSVLQEAAQHQKETLEPPPEKLEPYPYFGPFELSYPSWIWVALGIFMAAAFLVIFRWQRKRAQKQKLIEAAVTGMGSALTPYQDFNKNLRTVIRTLGTKKSEPQIVLDRLEKAFKGYLTRALTVPAFDWSEREILKDIKKYHKNIYQDHATQIIRLLREFDRAEGKTISVHDIEQMSELSRKTVEEIDRHQTHLQKGAH